jgi:hypothetical protein
MNNYVTQALEEHARQQMNYFGHGPADQDMMSFDPVPSLGRGDLEVVVRDTASAYQARSGQAATNPTYGAQARYQ